MIEKILVLGGSGLVGKAIINQMSTNKQFQIYGTYFENEIPLDED